MSGLFGPSSDRGHCLLKFSNLLLPSQFFFVMWVSFFHEEAAGLVMSEGTHVAVGSLDCWWNMDWGCLFGSGLFHHAHGMEDIIELFLETLKLCGVMVVDCFLLGVDHTLGLLGLGCSDAFPIQLLDIGAVESFEVLPLAWF